MSKFQRLLWSLPALAQLMLSPSPAHAEERTAAAASAEAEVRQAIRDYDEALRRADVAAVERFWASEYTFVNARGERLTRADRVANLRTGRTALDSLAHAPQDERIQVYGDIALYTTRFWRSAAVTVARRSRASSALWLSGSAVTVAGSSSRAT